MKFVPKDPALLEEVFTDQWTDRTDKLLLPKLNFLEVGMSKMVRHG